MKKALVVIPTYNEAENIERIIDRILFQGIKGLDILIVDDNSPDGTANMVKEIVNEMKGTIELVSEVEKGSLFKVTLPRTPAKSESESQLNNIENVNSVSTK